MHPLAARRLLLSLIAALLVVLAHAPAANAITNGTSAPDRPAVVRLTMQATTGGASCTGVLITPGHVLTAAHCINGADDLFGGSTGPIQAGAPIRIENTFQTTGGGVPQPLDVAAWTPTSGKQLWTMTSESPLHFGSPTMSEKDLAVVPLDNRVPLGVALPVSLPFGSSYQASACPQVFTGTFFGYSSGSREAAANTVSRLPAVTGDVYRASFHVDAHFSLIPGVFGEALENLRDDILTNNTTNLIEKGDSGGPMFDGSRLCGINSAYGTNFGCFPAKVCVPGFGCYELPCDPITGLCPYECGLTYDNRHARVDRQEAVTWLQGVQPPIFDDRGNLFATCGNPGTADSDNDRDFIPDACDPCPFVPDPSYRFTGNRSLPDSDGDDVPDLCDNCPDAANPRLAGSAQQPDADLDALGDACDKCEHSDVRGESDFACCNTTADCGGNPFFSQCLPIGTPVVNGLITINPCAGFAGRCSWGRDGDKDTIPDACDNCRSMSNPNQADDDDDGAGNVCDNCAGLVLSWTPYPDEDHSADKNEIFALKCSTDAQCVAKSGLADAQCSPAKLIPLPGGGLELGGRYCNKFPDTDGDGIGSACDNCPSVANPGSDVGVINNQPNCNLDIELARDEPYPYVGDACDPNPCTRTFETSALMTNTGDHVWLTLSLQPQVLPKSAIAEDVQSQASFDHKYTGTPEATVGARFCPCQIQGKLIGTVGDCGDGCPLNALEYISSATWTVPQLVPAPSNPKYSLPASPPSGYPFVPGAEFLGLTTEEPRVALAKGGDQLAAHGSAPKLVSWDLGNTAVDGFGLNKGKLGVLWTAVRDVPQMSPGSPAVFQSHSNHYDSNYYGDQLSLDINGKNLVACFWCQVDPCPHCAMSMDIHNLLIDPTQSIVAAQSATQSTDITSSFSSAAIGALLEPSVRWLQAAERGTWMKRGQVGLAALATDGTRVSSALVQVGGIVQPASRSASDASLAAALGAPSTGPAPRSDFAAVLSGAENAVFVVGGKLLADGSRPGDVWRYGIESREWMRLPISGPTPRLVLAATYQPETRSLWLIDADSGPGVARVLRMSLDDLEIEVVGLYPRAGQVARVELSNAPNGELLLSGTSTKLNRVASVVLRPSKHHLFTVGGKFSPGELALEPTLTQRGLTLPLVQPGGKVQNSFVAAEDVFYAPAGAGPGQTVSKPTKPVLEAPTKAKPTVADCL